MREVRNLDLHPSSFQNRLSKQTDGRVLLEPHREKPAAPVPGLTKMEQNSSERESFSNKCDPAASPSTMFWGGGEGRGGTAGLDADRLSIFIAQIIPDCRSRSNLDPVSNDLKPHQMLDKKNPKPPAGPPGLLSIHPSILSFTFKTEFLAPALIM